MMFLEWDNFSQNKNIHPNIVIIFIMGCCQPEPVAVDHSDIEIIPPSEHEYINSELLEMIKNDPEILFRRTDVRACFQLPASLEDIKEGNLDDWEKEEKESQELYASPMQTAK